MRALNTIVIAASAGLLAGCWAIDPPGSKCRETYRMNYFTASVSLPDSSAAATMDIIPWLSMEEQRLDDKPVFTNWSWIANRGAAKQPDSLTASLDTVDAQGPLATLPKPGAYGEVNPALGASLVTALLAGRGRITVRTSRGDSARAPFASYGRVGAFGASCIG